MRRRRRRLHEPIIIDGNSRRVLLMTIVSGAVSPVVGDVEGQRSDLRGPPQAHPRVVEAHRPRHGLAAAEYPADKRFGAGTSEELWHDRAFKGRPGRVHLARSRRLTT